MALSSMLSAVRELLLGGDAIPATFAERTVHYAARFPTLSPFEIEDLAKISPVQLATYTDSIIAGEVSTLRTHFPRTFAHLEREWPRVYGAPFEREQFMRSQHKLFPWRGYTTEVLAHNFVRHLEGHARLCSAQPLLIDLARFESAQLALKRQPTAPPLVDTSSIRLCSLNQLLDCTFEVPHHTHLLSVQGDVTRAIDETQLAPCSLVGVRDHHYKPHWIVLSAEEGAVLAARKGRVEELAHAFVTTHPGDEQAQCAAFLHQLLHFVELGGITVPSPQTEAIANI